MVWLKKLLSYKSNFKSFFSLIKLEFKSLSFLNLSSGVEKYSFELDLLTKNSISIKSFLKIFFRYISKSLLISLNSFLLELEGTS